MTYHKRAQAKKPEALPMWIQDLVRVKLDRDGHDGNGSWHGVGLPLYRYELRLESGAVFDVCYVRARSPANAITRIKNEYPNVQGVREL